MRTIEEISHDSYYNMQNYHQITIDLIEETENLLNLSDDETENSLMEEFGSLSYDISTVLEIFNTKLENEITVLKEF